MGFNHSRVSSKVENGQMRKLIAVALGSSFLLYSPSLNSQSLGGNCCADLEERVAELEATTVRKAYRNRREPSISTIKEYPSNAAALAAGLKRGELYRTGGDLKVVF